MKSIEVGGCKHTDSAPQVIGLIGYGSVFSLCWVCMPFSHSCCGQESVRCASRPNDRRPRVRAVAFQTSPLGWESSHLVRVEAGEREPQASSGGLDLTD
jgi:hypothetical protein